MSEKKALENIVEKGENAGHQHLLIFPQCFLLFSKHISNFESILFVICKCSEFGQGQNFVVW